MIKWRVKEARVFLSPPLQKVRLKCTVGMCLRDKKNHTYIYIYIYI